MFLNISNTFWFHRTFFSHKKVTLFLSFSLSVLFFLHSSLYLLCYHFWSEDQHKILDTCIPSETVPLGFGNLLQYLDLWMVYFELNLEAIILTLLSYLPCLLVWFRLHCFILPWNYRSTYPTLCLLEFLLDGFELCG